MIGWLTAGWNRVFAVLGKVSMYRMVFLALLGLTVVIVGAVATAAGRWAGLP